MINVASIDNLSGAPWRLLSPPASMRVHYAPPSAVYQALRQGTCDAGLLPTARLCELSPRYVPLGNYGIACTGAVRSVLLFSRVPMSQVIGESLPVHMTRKSETSRQLLRILARQAFGREPLEIYRPEAAKARLLIGGDAITEAMNGSAESVTDLGAWWFERTGLPFVFARWVVRRDLPAAERAALEAWVSDCVDLSKQHGFSSMHQHAPELDAEAAQTYYRGLRHHLGVDDLLGLDYFLELQREYAACRQTA